MMMSRTSHVRSILGWGNRAHRFNPKGHSVIFCVHRVNSVAFELMVE